MIRGLEIVDLRLEWGEPNDHWQMSLRKSALRNQWTARTRRLLPSFDVPARDRLRVRDQRVRQGQRVPRRSRVGTDFGVRILAVEYTRILLALRLSALLQMVRTRSYSTRHCRISLRFKSQNGSKPRDVPQSLPQSRRPEMYFGWRGSRVKCAKKKGVLPGAEGGT